MKNAPSESTDIFLYLHDNIASGGPYRKLWPQIRNYITTQLPRELMDELEDVYRLVHA